MSDVGEIYGALKDVTKARRRLFGVNCPQCAIKRPRAHPTILLPQQRCRVDGYRDPRPYLTDEQEAEAIRAAGYEPEPNA